MIQHRVAISLLAALFTALSVHAGDTLNVGDVPAWVRPVKYPDTIAPATDAAARVLLIDQQLNLQPTGDEYYFDEVIQVQTPQGLNALGNINLEWRPDTEEITVHRLVIHRGDQLIDVLGSGQSFTVLRREKNLEEAALDGRLTATLQPAGLQVGDIVDMAYTLRRSDPIFRGISEHVLAVRSDATATHVNFRAQWPARSAIKWRASQALSGAKERRVGDTTEVALSLDDLQPLVQPTGAPLRFAATRLMQFSGHRSWADLASLLAPLYEHAATLAPDSPVQAEIAAIRATSVDPLARATAALSLVQDKVRYVYLGMDNGALMPADATTTWARRFGDCKAKTALLLALLKGLDIPAEPVIVSTQLGDGLDEKLPMVGLFDHILVRTVIAGHTYWLDGTRLGDKQLSRIHTPEVHFGLPLLARGSALVPMHPEFPVQPDEVTTINIDASGGMDVPAPIEVRARFGGDPALGVKLNLGNLSASDRDRALRQIWSGQYETVTINSVGASFDEESGTETIAMSGTAKMDWSDDRFEIDKLVLGYQVNLHRDPGPASGAPYLVGAPRYRVVQETVILPDHGNGFSVSGENFDRTVAGINFRRTAVIENGVFKAEASERTVAEEFPASEADGAQKGLRDLTKLGLYVKSSTGVRKKPDRLQDPGNKPVTVAELIDRGNQFLDRKKYDEAIADFTSALVKQPDSAVALADRGMSYVWKRRWDLAMPDLDAAARLEPRNTVVLRARGLHAEFEKDYKAAISAYTAALETQPGNVFALLHRAQVYSASGDTENALADSATLLKLNPRDLNYAQLRSALLQRAGRIQEAREQARSLAEQNPEDPATLGVAMSIYYSIGDEVTALSMMDRVVALKPEEEAYLVRAAIRTRSDRAGRAADIDAALKLNARSVRALTARAALESEEERFSAAAATLTAAMDIAGPSAILLNERAIALVRGGEPGRAAEDFKAARAKATQPEVLNNLCWGKATANVELEAAMEECDLALRQAPEAVATLDSRAFVLLRLGRLDEAIKGYDEALGKSPNQAASLYGRGLAKRLQGDAAAGGADLEAARKLVPYIEEQFASYGFAP